jgi:hypothetical protein
MHFRKLKKLFFIFLVFLIAKNTYGQATISGTGLNTYARVTAMPCEANYVTVMDPTGFSIGDTVLLIQMTGADISQTTGANWGDVSNISSAGNYEIHEIINIIGSNIYFKYARQYTYTPTTAVVQLILIPQFTDVTVTGPLMPKAWDGNTGGVLVLQASGTVTLNDSISATNRGFRGGKMSSAGGTCSSAGGTNDYFAYPSALGGQKGEGITSVGYLATRESGRGKNANGGGGGNTHNTGGGGGANYGAGGRGGDKIAHVNFTGGCGSTFYPSPFGYGGSSLSPIYTTQNKIFMGGGGGGGQQNNNVGLDGGAGAGIVIIKAATLIGNGYNINAKGESKDIFSNIDAGDGAGGGGAGGTVLLEVGNISNLNVNVSGGKGGDTYYPIEPVNRIRRIGPGGGGGGGVVWVSASVFPASDINSTESGGANGITRAESIAWGAAPGAAGGRLTNLSIPVPTGTFVSCATVPVTMTSFSGKEINGKIQLNWSTAMEINCDHFTIERSTDGFNYDYLGSVKGNGNSNTLASYQYSDYSPIVGANYYRLKQYDFDGDQHIAGHVLVNFNSSGKIIQKVYPNPFTNELIIESPISLNKEETEIKIFSMLGTEIYSVATVFEEEKIVINTSNFSKGIYLLKIMSQGITETRRITKE